MQLRILKTRAGLSITLLLTAVSWLTGCGYKQDIRILATQTRIVRMQNYTTSPIPTIVSTVRETPVPTRTRYAPTIAQTRTPKPTSTITPTVIFVNPVIIFADESPHYYIVDSENGVGRYLFPEGENIERIYEIQSWVEGCTIIAVIDSGIAEISLFGSIVRLIFSFDLISNEPEGYRYFFKISPNEKWISYRLGTGEFHDSLNLDRVRSEVENILVQQTDGRQGPYQVSTGGDAIISAWSPDSKRLAFSDVDEAGIHQVYAVNPDGSQRRQLTHLDLDVRIEELQWSPDSSKLAIEYWLTDDGVEREIIIVKDQENPKVDRYRGLHVLWWIDLDNLLVFQPREDYMNGVIRQLGVQSGLYTGSEYVQLGAQRVIPYGNQHKVGFLDINGFFNVYDIDRNTVSILPKVYLDSIADNINWPFDPWIISPDSFPGEPACIQR